MTAADTLNKVFLDDPRGDFPFGHAAWIAVAFERNAYDNSRMPEWFFRGAAEYFGANGTVEWLIAGDCFKFAELPQISAQPFDWLGYHEFMLRPETYSTEYRMAAADGTCGCWADADITIFGGEPDRMSALLASVGGPDRLLAHMRQEFLLGDVAGYGDMDLFFQGLLFPSRRKPGPASGE
ncbi:MAG: hypothetical protein ACREP7_14015 [Lysobacter sp.]